MSVTPQDIAASRALRDEARAIVTAQLTNTRSEFSTQTIGKRIKVKATEEAVEVLDRTREVAADNKLLIITTVAVLAGWLARKSLVKAFDRLVPPETLDRLRSWRVD